MERFRLYCGLVRNGFWYNHAEVHPLTGGVLAMLDGAEKTGAAKLLNLIKGSMTEIYSEDGESYALKPSDYEDIKMLDSWKIGYEQIKLKTGETHPIIPESFLCTRCSLPRREQYTNVEVSWQELIDKGLIDEVFLDTPQFTYEVKLPDPIEIQTMKTIAGGKFDTIVMQHLSLGDVLKIHRNQEAMSSEANMIFASWDAAIIEVKGMSERDFNLIKRNPGQSFSKKYFSTDANQEAIEIAQDRNSVGIIADDRVVYCKNCGNEIREGLDYTNFFSLLLPKRSSRR
jgi:hypothetical protein